MFQRRLVDLNPGDSFGELALESEKPRAATVIATNDSLLITLDREVYQTVISGVNKNKQSELIKFFSSLPLFHIAADEDLKYVVDRV